MRKDTATLLAYADKKLSIPSRYLQEKAFSVLAVFDKKVLNFRIGTNSFYFIKINVTRKGPLKSDYIVNYGSEYDELAKPVCERVAFEHIVKLK
ncbi:hypothetical protein ACFQZI_00190 [Mucilaginibacter lutimaris]|uniref:Uncharacterized protein n=1 Tax=Mucilaginibacter lutimaris TaxID=931629 RepID=A0ABW2ZB51_9SPHI